MSPAGARARRALPPGWRARRFVAPGAAAQAQTLARFWRALACVHQGHLQGLTGPWRASARRVAPPPAYR